MSPPDKRLDPLDVRSLPDVPSDGGEPVFAEPWQAQAFALVIELSKHGYFTWPEWTQALADELRSAALDDRDDGSCYYDHWLAALERMVLAKGLTDASALAARKRAWIEAYQHTPHGKPVTLTNGH